MSFTLTRIRACPVTGEAGSGFGALGKLIVVASILLHSLAASAQDESGRYRAEAVQRLETKVRLLETEAAGAEKHSGLAHARFFLGSVAREEDAALTHFQAGLRQAEKALELEAGHPAAQLWAVVNRLRIFEIKKPFSALWKMHELEAKLLELKNTNEGFEYAAPDRVLAIIYSRSPGWLIGSAVKAERHFLTALGIAPDFPANTLLYAEFLLDENRDDEARALLSNSTLPDRFGDFPLYEMIWNMDLRRLSGRMSR